MTFHDVGNGKSEYDECPAEDSDVGPAQGSTRMSMLSHDP